MKAGTLTGWHYALAITVGLVGVALSGPILVGDWMLARARRRFR